MKLNFAIAAVWCFSSLVARADLNRRRSLGVEVVQKIAPAVVYIGTERISEPQFRSRSAPFLNEFFGRLGGAQERSQTTQSLGSGVIIDASGVVVTNEHVIRGASAIHVVLADGRQIDAEVIGSDTDNDLAVLKLKSKEVFPAAKLGNSSDLMIGESAIAIGSPFGLAKTVTAGVISAVGRSFKADGRVYNDFIQTDASINPGNSGGPLLNLDGEIIGINSAIFASAQGIGFAIPANKVKRIVAELSRFGKVRPAWVGIVTERLNPQLSSHLGWVRNYGALVTALEPGSPAGKSTLHVGDIIDAVDGIRVDDSEDFEMRVRGYPAHTPLSIAFFRHGKVDSISISPTEFPPKLVDGLAWDRLGIRLGSVGRSNLQVIAVRPGSPAEDVGLEPGDGILKLNNQSITSVAVFRETLALARSAPGVVLVVQRGQFAYHITLPF